MVDNRFVLAAGGQVYIVPCGKVLHASTGVVPAIDRAALTAGGWKT